MECNLLYCCQIFYQSINYASNNRFCYCRFKFYYNQLLIDLHSKTLISFIVLLRIFIILHNFKYSKTLDQQCNTLLCDLPGLMKCPKLYNHIEHANDPDLKISDNLLLFQCSELIISVCNQPLALYPLYGEYFTILRVSRGNSCFGMSDKAYHMKAS